MRENGSALYQQASPLDCHIRQSEGRLSGAAPETPGKYVTAYMYFFERSEAMKMEFVPKSHVDEEKQLRRLLAYQKQIEKIEKGAQKK